MKTLEKGQEKIDKICKVLREETLEPAKNEAATIVADAQAEAQKIISKAEKEAEQIVARGKAAMVQERSVFDSNLAQAGKQSLESLRQSIEKKLFRSELANLVEEGSVDPELIGKLIASLIDAVSQQGVKADLSAVIPASVDAEKVGAALGSSALKGLRGEALEVGDFKGGAQLKWHDKKLTIDISDEALKELMGQYVRKDFRKLLFGE